LCSSFTYLVSGILTNTSLGLRFKGQQEVAQNTASTRRKCSIPQQKHAQQGTA